VNLYPFTATIAKPGSTFDDAIENIDIGGPAMVRAAAKNHDHVTVIVDPLDYGTVLAELEQHEGTVSAETRLRLATKAFAHTAQYDAAVASYLDSQVRGAETSFPEWLALHYRKRMDLRYGENPHQQAAFYRDQRPASGTIANYRQLQGKALSYNNIADGDAAWECVKSLTDPGEHAACVIVKHANPCGVAIAASVIDAYRKALATDPVSAFGGIIAFNRLVDAATAEAVCALFIEVLIAPGYTGEALELLASKANVRVLEIALPVQSIAGFARTAWRAKRNSTNGNSISSNRRR